MNDQPTGPLDGPGTDPVEARIVAWVLGEASAFEAAELERLCAEDPALRSFHDRICEIHGHLKEPDEADDQEWKLSASRRVKLEELFGTNAPGENTVLLEKRIERSGRRALLAVAACVVLTFGVTVAVYPIFMKSQQASLPEKTVDFLAVSSPRSQPLAGKMGESKNREGFSDDRLAPASPAISVPAAEPSMELPQIAARRRDVSPEPMSRFGMGARGGAGAVPSDSSLSDGASIAANDGAAAEGDRLLNEGREAYSNGDYQQSVQKYREAWDKLPDQKTSSERRDSYAEHLSDASVALAMQQRKVGKYEEAKSLLDGALTVNPNSVDAKRELGYLEDPIRANPALADEHTANVDKIRRGLYTAEGNFNLGKYDDAKREYENVLRVDPTNSAARRGMEQVATAKSDYYRAAYDHTRAELLSQVDSAWESAVPQSPSAPKPSEEIAESPALLPGRARSKAAPASDAKGMANTGAEMPEVAMNTESSQNAYRYSLGVDAYAGKKLEAAPATSNPLKDHLLGESPIEEVVGSLKALEEPVQLEETAAAENPYSTFSLNVSDASFQVAKAALAKGERPDPAGIKVEQFYNAVDYGDPAPSAGEPVSATIEQAVHPVIPAKNLVRVALRTGATGRSALQPLRLTLLVDQSGSMVRDDRRVAMDHALSQLSVLLTKDDRVNVIGFSRTPRLLAENLSGDQANRLPDLINQGANEGGTNLEAAMKLASEIAARHRIDGTQNRIVLFTDGAANLGDANPERLAAQVKSIRQSGVAFDIAGIGADELNDRLLGELARNGNGRYYVVGSDKKADFARQLAGAFRPAAENVKVQVRFNPQRVARYKLIGFEKDRLKTEDFRNDAVDAAELAAEEAGVAIYQIENIPDGTGEVGELFVRFRDAASGNMVERSWTIPHEQAAAPFDRATPSLQLAGLSMLAAEKLRGGALADAIDFNRLVEPAASVKHHYGASPRVAEMLKVVDELK